MSFFLFLVSTARCVLVCFVFFSIFLFGSFSLVQAATPLPDVYPYESRIVIPRADESDVVIQVPLSPEILRAIDFDFSNFNLFNSKNEQVDFSLYSESFGKEKKLNVVDISSQKESPVHLIDNNLLTSFGFDERVDGKGASWVLLAFESPLSVNTVKLFPKERSKIRYVAIESGLTQEELRTTVSKQAFKRVYDISTPLVQYLKISFWGKSVKLDDIQIIKDEKASLFFSPKREDSYKLLYGGDVDVITYQGRSNKMIPFSGEGFVSKGVVNPLFPLDWDQDTIDFLEDNCPFVSNQNQVDRDGDRVGDVCDNAPDVRNITQLDVDRDGIGDIIDNCKLEPNASQEDLDADGFGNACDNAHAEEPPSPEEVEQGEMFQKYIPGVFLISLGIFLFLLLYKQKNTNSS